MDDTLDDPQVTLNGATFRDVNEGIERGRQARGEPVPLVSQCGEVGCDAVGTLTLEEYESARSGSRYFPVAPGHTAHFEALRREAARFSVVEKPDGPLGEIADRTDPRAAG